METFLLVMKWVLGLSMIFIGITHFRAPKAFDRIIPEWLPAHRALTYISGFFEILGGVGLLIPATQRIAAWGLVALYIAVFPANINMMVKDIPLGKNKLPRWAHWVRLPLQFVLIFYAWIYTR